MLEFHVLQKPVPLVTGAFRATVEAANSGRICTIAGIKIFFFDTGLVQKAL